MQRFLILKCKMCKQQQFCNAKINAILLRTVHKLEPSRLRQVEQTAEHSLAQRPLTRLKSDHLAICSQAEEARVAVSSRNPGVRCMPVQGRLLGCSSSPVRRGRGFGKVTKPIIFFIAIIVSSVIVSLGLAGHMPACWGIAVAHGS